MTPIMNDSEQIFRELNQIPVLYIVFLIAFSILLNSLTKRMVPAFAEMLPPGFKHFLLPMTPLFQLLITIVTLLLLIPTVVKPSIQNFVAIFGAVGLALGFAFKDFASSLIAGVVALYEQPYRVGDRVSINGIYGEVQAINLRSLRLVTLDDNAVTIPHSCIWNGSIQNANDGSREQQCAADFYLLPGHDPRLVRRILLDTALTSPYTKLSRPVKVGLSEFSWGTRYRIRAYPYDGRDELAFITDLTIRGKAALITFGIKFSAVSFVNSAGS